MSVKKVLHILSKYEGDYPLVDDFILSLDSDRYESLVCFIRGQAENRSRLEMNGIETVYLEKISSRKRGISLEKLFKLRQIVQEKGVDLIHCQRHKPTVYGVLTSMLAGKIPVITTIHGAGRTRSIRRKLANRFLFKQVDRIITVSNSVRKDVLNTNRWLDPGQVTTVQNGIEYSRLLNFDEITREQARSQILPGHNEKYWFGAVGRLTAIKNHRRLLRSFAPVVKKQPNTLLLIAGEGPLEEELKEMIQDLDLKENVYLLGYRKDIPLFLRSLDCFIFPSISEGLGLALLEAMASGLPVIVSNIDASREVIDGCDCGIYVDPMDDHEISKVMLKTREMDSRTHHSMGEGGKKRVLKSFSIGRMIQDIVNIYDAVLFPADRS